MLKLRHLMSRRGVAVAAYASVAMCAAAIATSQSAFAGTIRVIPASG